MLTLSLIGTAFAFESTPQSVDFSDANIPVFEGQTWSSDWVPSSGPVQLRLTLTPHFEADIVAQGDANIYWPQALEYDVQDRDTNQVAVKGSFVAASEVKVDLFGFEFEFDLDSEQFPISAGEDFDGFLLKGGPQESSQVSLRSVDTINYRQSLSYGFDLTGSIDLILEGIVGVSNGAFDVDGVYVDTYGESARIDPAGDAAEAINTTYMADIAAHSSYTIAGHIGVCYGTWGCFEVSPYAERTNIGVDAFTHTFPELTSEFPMPVADLGVDVLDFGDVPVGTTTSKTFRMYNDGLLDLEVNGRLQGAPSLVLASPQATVPSYGWQELTINVTPASAGAFDAIVTLTTNDPLQPTVEMDVYGYAGSGSSDQNGGGGGPGNTNGLKDAGGCGCSTNKAPSLMFALPLLALALRRRSV